MRRFGGVGLLATFVLGLTLTSCSSSSDAGSSGGLSVVASTNAWGSVVEQIAGRLSGSKVDVTAIITDPAADPHSYEANPRNKLAISRADLLIENGGGYDDFIAALRDSSGSDAHVINAVDVGATGSDNEHVWYDFPTVEKVALRIEAFLVAHDKADAATYRANARAFIAKLHAMEADEANIKQDAGGTGVAITEPVPLYLLDACGFVNRTPGEFSKAIEEGTDVSPRVLQDTLALFSAHEVKLLVYNEQTTGVETDQVKAAAQANHVPIVPVTETLPSGKTYLSWMQANLDAIATALRVT